MARRAITPRAKRTEDAAGGALLLLSILFFSSWDTNLALVNLEMLMYNLLLTFASLAKQRVQFQLRRLIPDIIHNMI